MVIHPARFVRTVSLLLGTAGALTTCAQVPVDPGQLPSQTSLYLFWHGTPSAEVRKINSLYALWDDPAFVSARSAWLESLLTEAQGSKTTEKAKLSREEFAPYLTLMDNALLIGALREPESLKAKRTSAAASALPVWNGTFFIYDRTGKEELLSKAVLQMRSQGTDIPKLTNLTVAGVSALKIERQADVTYWAEFGKHAVAAKEASVFEEIVQLLNGRSTEPTLSHSPSYLEARPLLEGGLLEFFVAVPSLKDIALAAPSQSATTVKPFLTALKLEALHSIAGHIVLEGPKTHLEGAILGDTRPGSLFDLWSDGQANPVSLSYVSSDTIYYSESQFNLLGIYQTLKNLFTQGPNNSGQLEATMEAAAETRFGMPLTEALAVPTGEIAWLQTSPTFEDGQKVYLLGITDKSKALKLTRTLLGDRISSEKNQGDATYLKFSLQGGASSSGTAQWNFYYLAITPALMLGSSKSEHLRQFVEPPPASGTTPLAKNLLEVRAKYPEKLNGFSYFDFQKVDWPGLQSKWIAEANKSAAKATKNAKTDKKFADWLAGASPGVLAHYLHTLAGASWKDAKGVHFDEWLE